MSGGTLGYGSGLATVTESVGALTLTVNSVIDFGSSNSGTHTFSFNGVNLTTGILSIWNWHGTPETGGGASQLITTGGYTGNLANVSFYSDLGVTSLGTGMMAGTEIVAVPEPTTILAGALLLSGLAIAERKRLRKLLGKA
jgi:hypothetical protein